MNQYDHYLLKEVVSHPQPKGKFRHIRERKIPVKLERGRSILDVGCAIGESESYFRKKAKLDYLGITHQPTEQNLAVASGRNVLLCDAHMMPRSWDEKFDYVYSSHMLEHAKSLWVTCQEILRVTKIGGLIIIVVPTGNATQIVRRGFHINYLPADILRDYWLARWRDRVVVKAELTRKRAERPVAPADYYLVLEKIAETKIKPRW